MIVDFWTADVSGLYGTTHRFTWERRDEREPGVRGLETLTLSLPVSSRGRLFSLPSSEVGAEYTMATPSKGQGARAIEIRGVVRLVEGDRVWVDLKARMERLDVPGVTFDEAVRGHFAIAK